MSYSILYEKQFIKVGDNLFIPMVECGDNNVYEASNGRKRARSWCNDKWIANGKTICTREDIENRVNEIRNDAIKRCEDYVKEYDETWSYEDKIDDFIEQVFDDCQEEDKEKVINTLRDIALKNECYEFLSKLGKK